MKSSKTFTFFLCVAIAGLILVLVPVDETRVSFLRLEHALNADAGLKDSIATHCTELTGRLGVPEEKYFLKRFAPERPGNEQTARPCEVLVESGYTSRFGLRTYGQFLIRVAAPAGVVIYDRSYRVEFPRPLCLLPVVAFLLALTFQFAPWGIGLTVAAYLFLLSGANAIQMGQLAWKVTYLTFVADPMFQGYLLVLAWLALFLSGREPVTMPSDRMAPRDKFINRVTMGLVGMWNPGVFAALGRLFASGRGSVTRVAPFLDAQLAVACLSLYLLSFNAGRLLDTAENALSLPRYFSFCAILFLALSHVARRPYRETAIAQYPRLWLAGLFVLAVEVAAYHFPPLGEFPTVVRVGSALLLSELVWPRSVRLSVALKSLGTWSAFLFLASFLATTSHTTGVTDLVIALASPRIHPTLFVFLMFAAGLALGFLTGNFAASFFALVLAVRTPEAPLARAALLDGILAGTLLSPFSIHNLIPAAQFGIRVHSLVAFRWKQIAFPFGIAALIYAVSAINSVAILQPVTFVFLCLVGLAIQLKKRTWTVGNIKAPTFLKREAV